MDAIGGELRQARQRLGLTLEEVERATRIRIRHLESIERGDLDALPSPVQARGFLHNYAEFLGLDSDAILLHYAEALNSRRRRAVPKDLLSDTAHRPSVQIRSRSPRWLSADLFIAAGITLAITAVVIWGIGRVMNGLKSRNEVAGGALLSATATPSPTVPQSQATLTFSVEVTSAALIPAATESPLPEITIGPGYPVGLRIQVEKRAWVGVMVDGEDRFRGRVEPGEVLDFQAREVVEVVTGNGGGLHIFYNGRDQGLLGSQDQVVISLWDKNGRLTPTPTATPVPSATLPPTRTPRVSATSTAISTPTPEANG